MTIFTGWSGQVPCPRALVAIKALTAAADCRNARRLGVRCEGIEASPAVAMTFMVARHSSYIRQSAAIMKRAIIPAALSLAFIAIAAADEPCRSPAIGTAMVAAVRDGRTLMLEDGRELRLAGIEAGDDGRDALQALVAGRALRLQRLGAETDRYGRVVALAFAGEDRQSVQAALLEQGQARVSARIGDKACAGVLLAAEARARVAKRGLWADPNFAPLQAEDL